MGCRVQEKRGKRVEPSWGERFRIEGFRMQDIGFEV